MTTHLLPPLKYFNQVWKLAEPILDITDPNQPIQGKVNVHRLFQVIEAMAEGSGELDKVTHQLAQDWTEVFIRSLENPQDTDTERLNLVFGLIGHLIEFLENADNMRGDGFDTFAALMSVSIEEGSCATQH